MKKLAVVIALTVSALAFAGEKYYVYLLSNGECEVDTRNPEQYKSARGGKMLSEHGYRMDAEKDRKEKVKAGQCKCPLGQNC